MFGSSRFPALCADSFTLIWNIGMIVSVSLPLLAYTVARLTNNEEYWNNQNQNNNNQEQEGENYYQNYYDQYGNYVGPTHWWQFWKKNNNNQYNNYGDGQGDNGGGENNNENNIRSPWWYIWGDDRENGNPEEEEGKGSVLFVYIWTLLLIAGLLYLGNTTNMAAPKLNAFRWALIGFLNYCLVVMVLLGGLEAIEVDGRELEEDGWYGQTSVLLFLTCLFNMILALVFISWSGKRIGDKEAVKHEIDGYVDVGEEGYKGPTAV